MKILQNLATNISIPFISLLVSSIPEADPQKMAVSYAWLGISQTYLFLKAIDPRADDFMEQVNKHVGVISETLVKSTEFQQSLLITFDALIRARNEEKRNIIKQIYLSGYVPAEDKKHFELERFYQTVQNLTLEAILFIKATTRGTPDDWLLVLPPYQQIPVDFFKKRYIEEFISADATEHPSADALSADEGLFNLVNFAGEWRYHEMGAELVSLGIAYAFYYSTMKPLFQTPLNKNKKGDIVYRITDFGHHFLGFFARSLYYE